MRIDLPVLEQVQLGDMALQGNEKEDCDVVVRSGSYPLESAVDVPLLCDIQSYGHCFEFVKAFSVESGYASQM